MDDDNCMPHGVGGGSTFRGINNQGRKRPHPNDSVNDDVTNEVAEEVVKSPFISAHEKMIHDNIKKNGGRIDQSRSGGVAGLQSTGNGSSFAATGSNASTSSMITAISKKVLGTSTNFKRVNKFVSPLISNKSQDDDPPAQQGGGGVGARNKQPAAAGDAAGKKGGGPGSTVPEEMLADERLKNVDPVMIEAILNEIMSKVSHVTWDEIAGLEHAKSIIKEVVIYPMRRPDIFSGLRGPPKGLLLFGPPGTGKTLIGKCIASQANATFFSISSSSLTSKWVGDGEKMVRALFAVARVRQPSVIFIDEIDSLLSQRSDGENEASRRIKTEFLVQFDGCGTDSEDRILLIGATNRPHELDEAAQRRFRKKLYIPLPEPDARRKMVEGRLREFPHSLSYEDIDQVVLLTEGYSGSDMTGVIADAAMEPVRGVLSDIETVSKESIPPISLADFKKAVTQVRASVSEKDLELYLKFDAAFGSKNR